MSASALQRLERGDGVEFHLRHVGQAGAGLDGVAQLDIVRAALADVLPVDLDVRVSSP